MRSSQLSLPLRARGGRRPGAGRKPKGPRPMVSHAARPRFGKPMPVLVTLRLKNDVWNLRSARCLRRLKTCFAKSLGRFGLRLIEFSVQGNHLHLIVEADGNESLSRGMQGLAVRIAKSLNRLMKRAGRLFADHYHSRLLKTPTELVRAIAYVLGNAARHFGTRGVDAFSSAGLSLAERATFLAEPASWLLRWGWKRVATS